MLVTQSEDVGSMSRICRSEREVVGLVRHLKDVQLRVERAWYRWWKLESEWTDDEGRRTLPPSAWTLSCLTYLLVAPSHVIWLGKRKRRHYPTKERMRREVRNWKDWRTRSVNYRLLLRCERHCNLETPQSMDDILYEKKWEFASSGNSVAHQTIAS